MAITEFSKTNLKQVRDEVSAALEVVNAKLGIKLQLGNIRFNANTFSAKLEGAVKDAVTGVVIDKELHSLQMNSSWALKGVDITKTYNDFSLGDIKIVGLSLRRAKYPVIVQQLRTGKKYKMSTEQVQRMAGVVKTA